MNDKDMTKNPTNNSSNSEPLQDTNSSTSDFGVAQNMTPVANNPEMSQPTNQHADILVVNYGEGYDANTYLPPDDNDHDDLADHYTQPSSTSAAKKPSPNPDDEEEIEFEKFLRLFKEKTRLAAQKTKTAAHNFRQNSLIRFAHWVSPKLDPYRQMTLPKKSAKTKTTAKPEASQKTTEAVETITPSNHVPTAKQKEPESSEPPQVVTEQSAATNDAPSAPDTPNMTRQENFELAEAAPYVPKTINEFLNLMRRTPKDVINPRERHVIATIMNFPNVRVSEIMQPAENITYVNYEEVLGPLTLDRLYRAGYDHFPVVDNRHKIIGLIHTTALNSLEIKETSRAGDLLDPKVYYVREDYTLNQALAAFLRTNCYFFLVIDRYEKIVGLLTYQMLMGYLLGETPEDDFYRDEDRLAVAKRKLS